MKQKIKEFWNKQACNIRHSKKNFFLKNILMKLKEKDI